MISKNIKYIPGLDHIRAFAALLIVLHHSILHIRPNNEGWIQSKNWLFAFLIEGHIAVGLFMVSSGFIFYLIAHDKEIDYQRFIYNRFLRIYPLFLFLIIVGVSLWPQNFSFLGFLQMVFGFSANGGLNLNSLSGTMWSIGVEFQFYLIFPFLMVFFKKKSELVTLILLMFMFKTIGSLLGANTRDFSYGTILGRLDQFVIGMLMAMIYIEKIDLKLPKFSIIPIVLLILFSTSLYNKYGGWPEVAYWKVLWIDYEGLLWATFIFVYLKTFNLKIKLLNSIGESSYSVYLLHVVIVTIVIEGKIGFIGFFENQLWNYFLTAVVVVLPVTLLLSRMTYNYIEAPFLNMRVSYIKKKGNGL